MLDYSINHMMVLILILVSVVPIVAFGVYSFEDEYSIIEENNLRLLEEIVHEKQIQVNFFFGERLSDVESVSKLRLIQEYIPSFYGDDLEEKSRANQILNEHLEIFLYTYNYETIWLVDNNFKTQLVIGKNFGEEKPLHLDHFSNDLDLMPHGVYLSDVYPGNFGAPSELFVSAPIFINEEQFGYVIFDIDLQVFFRDTLLELDQSGTGEIVLIQERDEHVFFIKQLRFDDSLPFSKFITSDEGWALPAIESSSGISGVGHSIDYRGKDIVAAWDYIPLTRWGVVAKIDTDEAFLDLNQRQRDLATIVLGFTASSFIIGYLLSRTITGPLSKIKESALKISQKDYDVHLKSTGPLEHKTISKTFNEMTKSIKFYEAQMEEYVEQLKSIDKQKGEFAAMASHELKTPLVPIKGYLEMLLEPGLMGDLTSTQKNTLEKILSNTEVLEKLILKLLMAQRLDLGEVKWNISTFDIVDLMNDVYSDNLKMSQEKSIIFENITNETCLISSDYANLVEVFSNLLQNAVDFTPENGKIEIKAYSIDGSIEFYVKDSGPGISKKHQKGLFTKFYQVDTSITRKHGGTGLGLSICKGLAEGLGGKIWVESEVGNGSTFFFRIPKKKTNPKEKQNSQ